MSEQDWGEMKKMNPDDAAQRPRRLQYTSLFLRAFELADAGQRLSYQGGPMCDDISAGAHGEVTGGR